MAGDSTRQEQEHEERQKCLFCPGKHSFRKGQLYIKIVKVQGVKIEFFPKTLFSRGKTYIHKSISTGKRHMRREQQQQQQQQQQRATGVACPRDGDVILHFAKAKRACLLKMLLSHGKNLAYWPHRLLAGIQPTSCSFTRNSCTT